MKLQFLALFFTLNLGCALNVGTTPSHTTERTRSHVLKFVAVYDARSDIEELLTLYSHEVILEDIRTATRVVGLEELETFFDWQNPDYIGAGEHTMKVDSMVVEASSAVVTGHFLPFSWKGISIEAMHFVILLTFDADWKILKEVDWINYPTSLVGASSPGNSNE